MWMGTVRRSGEFRCKSRHFPAPHIAKIYFFANVTKDVTGIGSPAREYIQGYLPGIRVAMGRHVAFVQQDNRRKTGRGIVAKTIADLRNDGGAGLCGRSRHHIQHSTVIEAYLFRNITAIDQKMFSIVQRIEPPLGQPKPSLHPVATMPTGKLQTIAEGRPPPSEPREYILKSPVCL